MKRFLLSFFVLFATVTCFSQTYPCVQFYSNGNLGGGDCQTTGTGGNKYYPGYLTEASNPSYFPTGKFTITFAFAIPAGTAAPEIVSAGPTGGPAFDYKYAAYKDDQSVERTSVVYCYYGSASNQNIFNGSHAPSLTFTIKYQINSTSTNCDGVSEAPGTLPVSFKSFTATKGTSSTLLKWTTATEVNSKGFYVQRYYNGKWENIMFVATKAEGGNSQSDLNYTYTDNSIVSGTVQYRILQLDMDGVAKYSDIRAVKDGLQANRLLLYPNPATNGTISIVMDDSNSSYNIQIIDGSGRIVKQFNTVRNTQQISNLPKGQYLAKVINQQSGESKIEKFIVLH